MMTYQDYLHAQGYSEGTVSTYDTESIKFQQWCTHHHYEPATMDYKTFLGYIKYLGQLRNGKHNSQSTIKHKVGALKIYFNYLVATHERMTNPIESIHIRGAQRSLNHNLLEFEELEELYHCYPTQGVELPSSLSVAIRNKVITGLMVYQGLNTTALKSLTIDHVRLEKGSIYIPSTRKTNHRELELKSCQILPLVQFVEKHRELLQEELKNYSQVLFPLNSKRFDIITVQLVKRLKRINHKVSNIKQIRASVITHWLSTYNIREVQYMAGHRYISSTERYVQDDLNNLHEMIENWHPIS